MVRLTRIYTRGGDKGETSLGGGARVPKHDLRVEAMGAVDETNAAIGCARLQIDGDVDDMLSRIQNDLFDLGADLATPDDVKKDGALCITPAQVERLESEIDLLNSALEPLNSFVLPGGSPAAANLHLARTLARRAERIMTNLAERDPLSDAAVQYINRLSDHLFVAARALNDNGATDVLWKPGENT
ncbi:MAG: cob(I)yrinic acid a,c-diamide adenosyltransferase [Flavobacteriales bacterium]|jgi:cob(I)alamin adenosyltransferase|nr:cob(I)yrinic acid a,c-diamide adenosyltransferase [Flavobacteriales bacterium]